MDSMRVNETGITRIKKILKARNPDALLTDENLAAWAAEAEAHFEEIGSAYIELGSAEIYELSAQEYDAPTALRVSAHHGHDGARDWSETASEFGGRLVGAGPVEKWRFPDGSGVVAVGEGWDVALCGDNPECMCPESEDEHADGCPLAHPISEWVAVPGSAVVVAKIEGFGAWGLDLRSAHGIGWPDWEDWCTSGWQEVANAELDREYADVMVNR
jgi:hypothetical protein